MYFRDITRLRLALHSNVFKAHAEKLEKLIFNASICHVQALEDSDPKSKGKCDTVRFRSVYNWIEQALLLQADDVCGHISNGSKAPTEIIDYVCRHAVLTCTPEEGPRISVRLYAIRAFSRFFSRAEELEAAVAAVATDVVSYRQKVRSLLYNMSVSQTGLLQRIRLAEGAEQLEEIVSGDFRTFWPEKWKRSDHQPFRSITIIRDSTSEAPSMLQCRQCKSYTVTYTEVQTRSADEPMTVFCSCSTCGKRWKM